MRSRANRTNHLLPSRQRLPGSLDQCHPVRHQARQQGRCKCGAQRGGLGLPFHWPRHCVCANTLTQGKKSCALHHIAPHCTTFGPPATLSPPPARAPVFSTCAAWLAQWLQFSTVRNEHNSAELFVRQAHRPLTSMSRTTWKLRLRLAYQHCS
jgi:hypothetical protein